MIGPPLHRSSFIVHRSALRRTKMTHMINRDEDPVEWGTYGVRLTDAIAGFQPGRRQERPSEQDLEYEILWLLTEAAPVQRAYIAARALADTLDARHGWLRAMQRQVAREGVAQSAALRGLTEMYGNDLAEAEEQAQATEQPLLDWARAHRAAAGRAAQGALGLRCPDMVMGTED
jgi:hypothetical protein